MDHSSRWSPHHSGGGGGGSNDRDIPAYSCFLGHQIIVLRIFDTRIEMCVVFEEGMCRAYACMCVYARLCRHAGRWARK